MKNIFKTMRPYIGLILMVGLILISSVLVFFSVAAGLVLPLLWMIFTAIHQFRKQSKKITYLWNASRLSMWIYFSSLFMLLIWTPEWVKIFSIHLERRTLLNVFKEGTYMYGRLSVSFALAVIVFLIFLLHYRWSTRKERTPKKTELTTE